MIGSFFLTDCANVLLFMCEVIRKLWLKLRQSLRDEDDNRDSYYFNAPLKGSIRA